MRKSRRFSARLLQAVAACLVAAGVTTAGPQESAVITELRRLEEALGGRLGFMAKNLRTGEEVRYNAEERFPTASVIKLPLMAAFFHRVDAKVIDPQMRITLVPADKKPGSGILQLMDDGATLSLLDAVKLMIVLSDNTATNMVLDQMAPTHPERLDLVNSFLASKGLENTRLLNKVFSYETKQDTPEAIRYGLGVATPEDMVSLLEQLYTRTLADSASCQAMIDILLEQHDKDMIPRFLPWLACPSLRTGSKTGSVEEVKADVGLVLSDTLAMAVAAFVDKSPDHVDRIQSNAVLLAAHATRAAWNHFTGMTGYGDRGVDTREVDWTRFPGGSWAIYRSITAPFPHRERLQGYTTSRGRHYPAFPHYRDSSIVVVVPQGFQETEEGSNVIVHFHGHGNDNLTTLERYRMPQSLVAERVNAILIIPQGPFRAPDDFAGKMEDDGGLARLVEDVLATLQRERLVTTTRVARLILSAHSGGFRAVAFCLDRGGLTEKVSDVFLFDAFYGNHDSYRHWLLEGQGTLFGAYTNHLKGEHIAFERELGPKAGGRLRFTRTDVGHEEVVQAFFGPWLRSLDASWKKETNGQK